MVAVNAKVIYRFAVRVFEEIFCTAWMQRDFVSGDLCLPRRRKYPEKVISLAFQTNINLHMFRDEFPVKKQDF